MARLREKRELFDSPPHGDRVDPEDTELDAFSTEQSAPDPRDARTD